MTPSWERGSELNIFNCINIQRNWLQVLATKKTSPKGLVLGHGHITGNHIVEKPNFSTAEDRRDVLSIQ